MIEVVKFSVDEHIYERIGRGQPTIGLSMTRKRQGEKPRGTFTPIHAASSATLADQSAESGKTNHFAVSVLRRVSVHPARLEIFGGGELRGHRLRHYRIHEKTSLCQCLNL